MRAIPARWSPRPNLGTVEYLSHGYVLNMPMPTDCKKTQRDVLLFRDGELPKAEREAFSKHLAGCPDCRARQADAEVLSSLMGEAFQLMGGEPPQGFANEVMREIRRRPAGKTSPWLESISAGWRWLVLGGVVLAAAVATVVVPLLRAQHGSGAPLEEVTALQVENEAHIHRLSVDSSDTHPVVLQTAEGHTVIWMISDSQFGADAGGPESP
jgi:anti-sigma factor RsiW